MLALAELNWQKQYATRSASPDCIEENPLLDVRESRCCGTLGSVSLSWTLKLCWSAIQPAPDLNNQRYSPLNIVLPPHITSPVVNFSL
jgi:hypothetical protein